MASSYDLRSSQGQDAATSTSQYAALPGTNTEEHFQINSTAAKSRLLTSGREVAGCHPSRWVYELLHNKFSVCDMFDRARHSGVALPSTWEHTHRLVINGNQSYVTDYNKVLSTICLDCHNHLVFKMSWDKDQTESLCNQQQARWPLPDNKFPWHHLTWIGSDSDPNVMSSTSKYYPLLAREFFACTCGPCTFELTLEVSKPRIAQWFIDLLQDQEAILEQLNVSRELEPSRYESASDDWAKEAPLNLNTYLKNLLESDPDQVRSISKRNKRFAVLFGPRCFGIFNYLEFENNVIDRDGVDEGNFKPPAPDPPTGPHSTTEIRTYRAFLEDVRSEVQCLIHRAGQSSERPTFCAPHLYEGLGAQEVTGLAGNPLVDTQPYMALGVLPNQSREIVVNAYKRQWDRLPSQRRVLVDSLMAIANHSGDEQLSEFALVQSSVFDSQTQSSSKDDDDGVVPQALAYLGLQPPNNHSADAVLQAFRAKLAATPGDAATARSMLQLIASNTRDEDFQIKMVMETDDHRMTFDTARIVLGLTTVEQSWAEILALAREKIDASADTDAKSTLLDALNSVAEHTQSAELKQGVADLRRDNQIQATGPVGHSTDNRPVDWALPVGLNNIGNTCYLNSLLQYLYTVKAVRDITNNYDDFKLDLEDEVIQERRLGGNKMQMDRGEAVVAQAFVHELGDLFAQLQKSDKAATRPSQRLANAVLLSTRSLLEPPKPATSTTEQAKEGPPPPLPARPSPAAPDAADQLSRPFDLAGNDSTETLVGNDEVDSEPSYEKVEHIAVTGPRQQTPPVADIEVTKAVRSPVEPSTLTDAPAIGSDDQRDTDMADVEDDSVDKKVLNALEHQTRSSGTDQQDVEEVIGSIINRLQAAIKPSEVDQKTGIQLEKIMETFFVTTINYTKKFDDKEYQHEISFDRSITAYPSPDGPCSLYDALGRNFDQQIMEESKLSRYTAIKTLPPVLHVLLQRSQSIGRKNGNPVVIPETLYLDRYMDAPHESPAFRRRVEDWSIASRVEELKKQKAQLDTTVSTAGILEPIRRGTFMASEQASTPQEGKAGVFESETWDFDGPVDNDFLLVNQVTLPDPAEDLNAALPQEEMHATEKAIQEMMETELQQREQKLEEHRAAGKEIPYRLHAVICHRGHLTSGHYWVWIRDFEDNLWRWYNDADVKENKNTEDVLKTLSSSGEPYYLCYVRDSDKEKYVDVPKRERPEGSAEQATTAEELAQAATEPPRASESLVQEMSEAPQPSTDEDGDVVIEGQAVGSPPHDDWGVKVPGAGTDAKRGQSPPPEYTDW
ncbi:ubiquitin carboxyl-terminal hydrolase domain-containing protein [Sarocladium implicatum]|nr:ubiquitin carboxyl-terminal hydrolase domain-containing protein [Sarocladium implicatum]